MKKGEIKELLKSGMKRHTDKAKSEKMSAKSKILKKMC